MKTLKSLQDLKLLDNLNLDEDCKNKKIEKINIKEEIEKFDSINIIPVGIATTNPTETLDVNGSLRVRDLYTGTCETNQFGAFSAAPYTLVCYGIFKDNGENLVSEKPNEDNY
jgi:hypothetical protein